MHWSPFLFPLLILTSGAVVVIYFFRCQERCWEKRLAAERNQAAKTLEEHCLTSAQARAEQRALFESMAEGVLLLDRGGRISMANKSLKELLRVSVEIRGKTILEAFRNPRLADLAAELPKKQIVRHCELELPGTAPQLVEVNASAVLNQQGGYEGAIFVFHDLTRIKQLENTRREFVANVSHELRTPLSLIKGFVETLLDGAKNDPGQTERFLQTIEKHTDRLTYLIEDLLTISRLESGQVGLCLQPVMLCDLVQRVVDDLRGRAAARHTRIENLLPPSLEARVDADRFQQVISNLVENAIKYGREGGRVILEAHTNGDAHLTLTVQDDGPGIPPEAQARIFERFYRVDCARSRETGGTGLGLAIVKHIVLAHGGTVWVKSELGKGAAFCFTLPRLSRPPTPRMPSYSQLSEAVPRVG